MKFRSAIVGLFLVLLLMAAMATAATISEDLRAALAATESDEPIAVILELAEGVDPSLYTGGRETATTLNIDLRATAERTQAPVLEWLRARGVDAGVRTFWINNSIALRATPNLIRDLAVLDALVRIDLDVPVRLPEITAGRGGQEPARSPVWSQEIIRTPEVWTEFGLTGEGIVVGSMDTGVDIDHPALQGKWRGGDNGWVDLVNGLPAPYDDHGHGTHTIGTMVGGDGPGPFDPDIGVAPGARFISAKVLDANNSFSSASIVIAGAEWILDPDDDPATDDFPHVCNNSWYFFSQTYTGFHAAAAAWRAAGIVPVFCLGNEGPNPNTTRPPANYDNVLGVSATTSLDAIMSFSSRGPSPAGWAFPDDRRKPDLAAPGAAVTSSLPGGGYADWWGTSMASPHVAGVAALMLQAKPELTYDEIRAFLLDQAVDLGDPGWDVDFGYGRLDAYATIEAVTVTAVPEFPGGIVLHPGRPNPFNPLTTIAFELAEPGEIDLGVYDLQGRRIAVLTRGHHAAGRHTQTWNGRDARGRAMPSGTYVFRLDSGAGVEARKVMLVR